jgi:hypothetical protein
LQRCACACIGWRGGTKNLTFVLNDITWLDRDNERGRKEREREKVRAEVGRE